MNLEKQVLVMEKVALVRNESDHQKSERKFCCWAFDECLPQVAV